MFDVELSERSNLALSGRSILVVDDSATNRDLAAEALRMTGAEVEAAETGGAALALIRRKKYDLVLLDLDMPGVDGYAVGAAVRSSCENAQTPIVLFTAADDTDAQRALTETRAQDIVHKPVDVDALMEVVAKHLA